MNYAKTTTNTTETTKVCRKCQTKRHLISFESGRNVCRVCRKSGTGLGIQTPQKRKEQRVSVKYEYEARELWQIPEFNAYADLIASVFKKEEWLTIAEIHRRLREPNVIRKWTYDAIEARGILKDATRLLDRFRLV